MAHSTYRVLRTDTAGMPIEWIDLHHAIRLHCLGHVAYSMGDTQMVVRGGINARSRRRSRLVISSIIATHGHNPDVARRRSTAAPPVSNPTLFQRDDHLCLYCGSRADSTRLSRDHVRPLSQGGANHWNNLVTACIRCNHFKAGRTPEQAGMELLAVPFTPTHVEYIYLQGRNILADQMAFLHSHFPRSSRLRQRLGTIS
jgi:hypothetical protein